MFVKNDNRYLERFFIYMRMKIKMKVRGKKREIINDIDL